MFGCLDWSLFSINGPTPAYFLFFSIFSIKNQNFYKKSCEYCPSNIRHQDSNSQPTDYESPPLTTRPGLPPLKLVVGFSECVYKFKSGVRLCSRKSLSCVCISQMWQLFKLWRRCTGKKERVREKTSSKFSFQLEFLSFQISFIKSWAEQKGQF